MKKLSLKELNRVNIAEFKAQAKTPMVLVLDNVRSALNVGSAFRTADAFALQHVHLDHATFYNPCNPTDSPINSFLCTGLHMLKITCLCS